MYYRTVQFFSSSFSSGHNIIINSSFEGIHWLYWLFHKYWMLSKRNSARDYRATIIIEATVKLKDRTLCMYVRIFITCMAVINE